MKLYFMRHGHAEPGGSKPDEQRELTTEGVRRIQNAAAVIARLNVAPAHIYSSPRVRARQTAEQVAARLNIPLEIHEAVNFGFSEAAVADFVAAHGDADLMFVGHEPTMSQTIQAITHGGSVVMKPGSLARVDVTSQGMLQGELVWLIAPKVFDALAGA